MHKFHAKEFELEFLEWAASHATIFKLERILKNNLYSLWEGGGGISCSENKNPKSIPYAWSSSLDLNYCFLERSLSESKTTESKLHHIKAPD